MISTKKVKYSKQELELINLLEELEALTQDPKTALKIANFLKLKGIWK